MFTSSEYFDMLVLYGQCDESATVGVGIVQFLPFCDDVII
jgi:hypothetical protein